MAKLSDDEKAKAILGNVEPEGAVEPTKNAEVIPEEEPEQPEVESSEEAELEEEKPTEGAEESEQPIESSFTKQFPNLNGDTPEEYLHSLEQAYDNSFKEALRMNQELKDNAAVVTQAREIVAQGQQLNPEQPVSPQLNAIDEHPVIKEFQEERRARMISAFDDFKKDYPQVLDQANFDAFTKASDGINMALSTALGHKPSDPELFKAIAGSLGWQPAIVQAKKNNAIKESISSGRTPSGQAPVPPKPSKVSDAQVDVYLKMYTSKTREDAIKELSEVV